MNGNQNENKLNKDIFDFFRKELITTTNLKGEINKDCKDLQIDVIKQKRAFFYRIVAFSGAILGITKFYTKPQNPSYFLAGLILFLFLILFILFYIRESLDKDSAGLRDLQDEYGGILGEKAKLLKKYLTQGIFTEESLNAYFQELKSSEAYGIMKDKNDALLKGRKDRLEEKDSLDFTGEFVVFLFTLSSFFTILSLIKPQLDWVWLLASVIFLAYLSFSDVALTFMRILSTPFQYLKRHGVLLSFKCDREASETRPKN